MHQIIAAGAGVVLLHSYLLLAIKVSYQVSLKPRITFGHRSEEVETEDKQGEQPPAYLFPNAEPEKRSIGLRSKWTSVIRIGEILFFKQDISILKRKFKLMRIESAEFKYRLVRKRHLARLAVKNNFCLLLNREVK